MRLSIIKTDPGYTEAQRRWEAIRRVCYDNTVD